MGLKAAIVFISLIWSTALWAQSWVQIEAQPSEAEARARADAYAARIDGINVFRMRSGWYAIAIGPFDQAQAVNTLRQYRSIRAIPSDSFIEDEGRFRGLVYADNALPTLSEPTQPAPELVAGEETQAEARASERALTRDERASIQVALKWEGVYNSTIDASFGPGTRRAMAAWQEVNGFEPTGILTTLQRRQLIDGYQQVLAALDMSPVNDPNAGIDIALPEGLVQFDRYEAPFAHFNPATDDDVRVLLISQRGDGDTLTALYDVLQSLEVIPLEGRRNLGRNEFTINGANSKSSAYAYARLAGDTVKGFILVWPADDEKRFNLALSTMRESFTTNEGVLPDTAGGGAQDIDLLAGLEIRKPSIARSGFFADGQGLVLTTSAAVSQCARITLDGDSEADVVASDSELGLALLKPRAELAPISTAYLASAQPRLSSDMAVAGYSFGGVLGAPSVTFGTLADVKGLNGDGRLLRLEVQSEEGDRGGPVFDGFGAVQGLLLDSAEGSRKLPGDVAFAANAGALTAFLNTNGVSPLVAEDGLAVEPEDLEAIAADITVLVSCWN